MKAKALCIFLSLFLSFNSFAQIKYEKGYFIDEADKRTDCLIKNVDWNYNPTEFNYKLDENTPNQTATITNVKEFGIINISLYKRFTIDIDRSSDDINSMSKSYNPEFKKEQLFLKVLVDGKASLYKYESINLTRFFYSTDTVHPTELIFKTYLVSDNATSENNTYKQQLLDNIKSENVSAQTITASDYTKHDLVKIFTAYNNKPDTAIVRLDKKQKKEFFNLTVRPGLNISNLKGYSQISTVNFGSKENFRIGIEAAFILPFNANKWSILIEPTYQYYKASYQTSSIDYKTIQLPVGIRYDMFLNNKSRIFLNALITYDINIEGKLALSGNEKDLTPRFYTLVGGGYKYTRYSVEARYEPDHNIVANYGASSAKYNTFSIILGYTFLK
jgi:hypothetical protein